MAALEGARFGGRSFLVPAAEDAAFPGPLVAELEPDNWRFPSLQIQQ